MPAALQRAQMLDAICRRWPGYTLATALAEGADLIYSTLEILALAKDK